VQWLVIGGPETRRVALFQAALARQGQPPAHVVAYPDLIAGRVDLRTLVHPGTVVRIESPDRDFPTEQAILVAGAACADPEGDYARLSGPAAAALLCDKGAIRYPRQWYLGYCAVLRQIQDQLAAAPPHRLMSPPAGIALMFDKRHCQAILAAAGVPVPASLGPVASYADLRARMTATGQPRVFVKLAHGSSASGVVAYQVAGGRHQATTTVEMVPRAGGVALYNSRRIRVYRDPREIAVLIDALCRHRVQVEQWVPKAGLGARTCDLRVLVIAGQVQHVVVRLSRSPLTNLHLANERAGLAAILPRLGAAGWAAAAATCTQVMHQFPASLYAGIDLLITADYQSHVVGEVNAFGDLLYDTLHAGRDPYEAEIVALTAQARAAA